MLDTGNIPTAAIIFEFFGTPSQIMAPPIFSTSLVLQDQKTIIKQRSGRGFLLSFLAAEIAAESTFFWIVPKSPFLLNTKSINDHITRKVFVVHLSETHNHSANVASLKD